MTRPKDTVRILKAAAVLLETDDQKIRSAVLIVTKELVTKMWTDNWPTFRRQCDIMSFWKAVVKQTLSSPDVAEMKLAWKVGDGEPDYGRTFQIELVTKPSGTIHEMEITVN